MGVQYVLEQVIGLQGMINYVDARTSWMDDIVKQAQWQGITQVRPPLHLIYQLHFSASALAPGQDQGYRTYSLCVRPLCPSDTATL